MPTAEQIAKRMTYDPEFAIGENVRDMMAVHIAHEIKAERERCAKIAEAFGELTAKMAGGIGSEASALAHRIAEAIRDRNEQR